MEIPERVSDTRKLVLRVNGENVRRSLPDNLNRGGDPKEERVERFGGQSLSSLSSIRRPVFWCKIYECDRGSLMKWSTI